MNTMDRLFLIGLRASQSDRLLLAMKAVGRREEVIEKGRGDMYKRRVKG